MLEIQSSPNAKDLKVGIVVSRWNELITESLLRGAKNAFAKWGGDEAAITVVRVPGSLEIPSAVSWMAESKRFDGIIALGAVIRGETSHYDHVAGESIKGVQAVALRTGVPVSTGILTTNTVEEALNRAGIKAGNKGAEALETCLEMANLKKSFEL